MKGFKGFDKDFKCFDKQYKENEVFEEEIAEICKCGMHFCENPLDVLDYYPLIDDEGNLNQYANVEALDETYTDDNKKFCTKKLKIGAKLDLKGLIKASFDFLWELNKYDEVIKDSGNYSQLASSGDYSQLASSGYNSKLASSGDYSQLASSGDYSQLASSGYNSKLASSGYNSKLASSGDYSKLASSGNYSKLASSGDYSKLAMDSKNSVGANIGTNGIIKGKIGCWITLAEYDYDYELNEYICLCVKSAQIDGKDLKEDTWYKLENSEFVEVK